MFKKSPTDYTDKTDYDGFNSHESHEFSRISDCIKSFILFTILSHEFSPDGELFCEYIMIQSCKSIVHYIELKLL